MGSSEHAVAAKYHRSDSTILPMTTTTATTTATTSATTNTATSATTSTTAATTTTATTILLRYTVPE